MSVFTSYLVQALQGRALEVDENALTFEALTGYVTRRVVKWALNHRKSQTPNYKAEMIGELVFDIPNALERPTQAAACPPVPTYDNLRYLIFRENYFASKSGYVFHTRPDTIWGTATLGLSQPESVVYSDSERMRDKISARKSRTSGVFTILVNFVKPSEIKSEGEGSFTFSFGRFDLSDDSEFGFNAVLQIDYSKIDDSVRSFLKQIDSQSAVRWDYFFYVFDNHFDFDLITDICKRKSFSIVDFNPAAKELTIKLTGSEKDDLKLTFWNSDKYGAMRISQGYTLDAEFLDKIPTDHLIHMFLPALKVGRTGGRT
jgi:hypothetical protein